MTRFSRCILLRFTLRIPISLQGNTTLPESSLKKSIFSLAYKTAKIQQLCYTFLDSYIDREQNQTFITHLLSLKLIRNIFYCRTWTIESFITHFLGHLPTGTQYSGIIRRVFSQRYNVRDIQGTFTEHFKGKNFCKNLLMEKMFLC